MVEAKLWNRNVRGEKNLFSSFFRVNLMTSEMIRQCMKCWHKWDEDLYLRKNGEPKTSCPKCNSYNTLLTFVSPTNIVVREDLLMLTGSQYPRKYCPQTSLEELRAHLFPEAIVVNKDGVKIFISRGWSSRSYGHYAYLSVDKKMWMTTDKNEDISLSRAVDECPTGSKVFIGGLGLGFILLKLAQSRKTRVVTVVELDKRIINIVEPIIRPYLAEKYPQFNWEVYQGDAISEVKDKKFDWIFFDIWSNNNPPPDEPTLATIREATKDAGKLTLWVDMCEGLHGFGL